MAEAPLRAFVALELDADARERAARALRELGPRLPGVRLVPAANIHLTLRFLGPAQPRQLELLEPLLADSACTSPPVRVRFAGAGTFPERGAPSVLWLGLETEPPLEPLHDACERAARGAGFAPEARRFRPHVTVGRFRARAHTRPRLPQLWLGESMLERLTLFRSELRPGGARHTPLASFVLSGRA